MNSSTHGFGVRVGDVVRQYATPARVSWTDALVTFVHGNGALDVRDTKTGECYGWSESMCEVVTRGVKEDVPPQPVACPACGRGEVIHGECDRCDFRPAGVSPAVLPMSENFRDTVRARPLAYTLDEYWQSVAGNGPLGFTWKDKPHRIVYDLLAAVRYYSEAGAGVSVVPHQTPCTKATDD